MALFIEAFFDHHSHHFGNTAQASRKRAVDKEYNTHWPWVKRIEGWIKIWCWDSWKQVRSRVDSGFPTDLRAYS